jgi:hypothetical protein
MKWSVTLEYEDGRAEGIGEPYEGLDDATIAALQLADHLGKNPSGDGHGRPVIVRVHMDGQFELAITIIKGGLTARSDSSEFETKPAARRH